MGDYSALSRQTQWSHRGREIRDRGDDAKTEGTKAVWPRSRESKAASRCWRRQGRDAPESTSSDDVFTLAQEDSFPTPDLQNHKRISSCCSNHFICGNLLQEHRKWIYCIFILVGHFTSSIIHFHKMMCGFYYWEPKKQHSVSFALCVWAEGQMHVN